MWLNLYGWSALIGVGLVVGAVIKIATPLPIWTALMLGVVGVWGATLLLDYRRHRNSTVHLVHERFDSDSAPAVVSRLAGMGITATYHEYAYDDEDETLIQRGILCRQADVDVARRVLSETLS